MCFNGSDMVLMESDRATGYHDVYFSLNEVLSNLCCWLYPLMMIGAIA